MNEPLKKEIHCPYCRRRLRLRKNGIVRRHEVPGEGMCPQGGKRLGASGVPSKLSNADALTQTRGLDAEVEFNPFTAPEYQCKPFALEYEGTFEPQSGPNGECLICGGIEACKPGCKDGDFGIP